MSQSRQTALRAKAPSGALLRERSADSCGRELQGLAEFKASRDDVDKTRDRSSTPQWKTASRVRGRKEKFSEAVRWEWGGEGMYGAEAVGVGGAEMVLPCSPRYRLPTGLILTGV
jgi:hypothetical protein